jgi:hypothetical protein
MEYYLFNWDVSTGERLERTSWRVRGKMTISPSGGHLAYTSAAGFVLYDLATKQETVLEKLQPDGFYTFSADGSLLALPCISDPGPTDLEEAFVRIVETATGKIRFSLPRGTGPLNAFSPDGRYLLTTSLKEFRLWEIATSKEVLRQPVDEAVNGWHDATFANQAAVAPDGRSAATSMPDGTIVVWDLLPSSRPKGDLTAKDLDSLWADLASEDAAKAYSAGGRLLSDPDRACAFLGKQLHATDGETERIRGLITALNDDDFSKREAASKELRQLGLLAEPELRGALNDKCPAETRRTVKDLLDRLETMPTVEERQQIRALWVLEQIGSAEARKTLERLAGGAAAARQTREAKSTLQRLKAKE